MTHSQPARRRLNVQELDYQKTALGELILLRRCAVEADGREIFEVKLNEAYLMSSLFYEGEVALADLALAELDGGDWDVVVGGLGLGYTAVAALAHEQVARLTIVEALAPVIGWHERGLVTNGATLSRDPRCRFLQADFFALARRAGFAPGEPERRFDAILLDIDHTPDDHLHPSNEVLYTEKGMEQLRRTLRPGGVFGMWSNEAPERSFLAMLERVFGRAVGHVVEFANPIQGGTAINGVYVATAVSP